MDNVVVTVIIIPVADASGKFNGSEYLQLYKRLEISPSLKMAIYNPNETFRSILVEDFLK
jgi:hypothetical protein